MKNAEQRPNLAGLNLAEQLFYIPLIGLKTGLSFSLFSMNPEKIDEFIDAIEAKAKEGRIRNAQLEWEERH